MQTVDKERKDLKKLGHLVGKTTSRKKRYLIGSLDRALWVLQARAVYPELVEDFEKESILRIVRAGQLWLNHRL